MGETELSQHCELHVKEFCGYHNKKPYSGKVEYGSPSLFNWTTAYPKRTPVFGKVKDTFLICKDSGVMHFFACFSELLDMIFVWGMLDSEGDLVVEYKYDVGRRCP